MQLSVLFLSLYVIHLFGFCENVKNNTLRSNKEIKVFAYVQGYKDGQSEDYRIPGYLITPVMIATKINKANAVTNEKNIKTTNNTTRTTTESSKLLTTENDIKTRKDNDDIEVNFRQALNRGSLEKKDLSEVKSNGTMQQFNATIKSTTVKYDITSLTDDESKVTQATTQISIIEKENLTSPTETTTTANGPYPTAAYNNEIVNSLSLTTLYPDNFQLPPEIDERWKNFTETTHNNENYIEQPINTRNISSNPSVNNSGRTIKGVYPAAPYNNAEIDQLSITTNSNTNEFLLPSQDDRWMSFTSLRKMLPTTNMFKPLAGLYYDGFLHRPLPKMPGFVPYNHYFLT